MSMVPDRTPDQTVPFALHTQDDAWIARHHGTRRQSDGRVVVYVPADEVDMIEFAGYRWMRHTFGDPPDDAITRDVCCRPEWVS